MISHKHKFVFIAIPRTGTTSVETALKPYCDEQYNFDHTSVFSKHTRALTLKKFFKEKKWNWDDYFKFTFVRNPWELNLSLWHYINQSSKSTSWQPTAWVKDCKRLVAAHKNFESYIKSTDAPGRYSYFTHDETHENEIIDFIGKLENCQQDFDTICDKIALPRYQLPHINKTKHEHYAQYYNEETKEIVREKYKSDIERFKYKFMQE
jgi:hypothetical protein